MASSPPTRPSTTAWSSRRDRQQRRRHPHLLQAARPGRAARRLGLCAAARSPRPSTASACRSTPRSPAQRAAVAALADEDFQQALDRAGRDSGGPGWPSSSAGSASRSSAPRRPTSCWSASRRRPAGPPPRPRRSWLAAACWCAASATTACPTTCASPSAWRSTTARSLDALAEFLKPGRPLRPHAGQHRLRLLGEGAGHLRGVRSCVWIAVNSSNAASRTARRVQQVAGSDGVAELTVARIAEAGQRRRPGRVRARRRPSADGRGAGRSGAERDASGRGRGRSRPAVHGAPAHGHDPSVARQVRRAPTLCGRRPARRALQYRPGRRQQLEHLTARRRTLLPSPLSTTRGSRTADVVAMDAQYDLCASPPTGTADDDHVARCGLGQVEREGDLRRPGRRPRPHAGATGRQDVWPACRNPRPPRRPRLSQPRRDRKLFWGAH